VVPHFVVNDRATSNIIFSCAALTTVKDPYVTTIALNAIVMGFTLVTCRVLV
jgi:hypothetical protein